MVRKRWFILVMLAVLASTAFWGTQASAKKPPKPPPQSEEGGTIYFVGWYPDFFSMDSDGSNKTVMPEGVKGEPSRDLHGGHRWFLQLRDIEGEVYPDCEPRRELFAVRDDGDAGYPAVQLTDDPYLKKGDVRWVADGETGDSFVSLRAVLWTTGTEPDCETPPPPVEGGLYLAGVYFDQGGNVIPGLGGSSLIVYLEPAYDIDDGWTVSYAGYDWSPDGSQVVYTDGGFNVVTSSGQPVRQIPVTDGYAPRWSPDDTEFVFGTLSSIDTIRTDGTNRQVIIEEKHKGAWWEVLQKPLWSPTGDHIIYRKAKCREGGYCDFDIFRATATGGGLTNLTGDVEEYCEPAGWR